MNIKQTARKLFLFLLLAVSVLLTSCKDESSSSVMSYVDPDIGGVGLLLQPTRPVVQLPNQMIRVYPSRKDYLDDQIRSFPLTLISHRNGELFGILPFTGKMITETPVSAWDNQLESTTPYYLKTWLEDYNITVEFTPGRMTGYFRFTYPEGSVKNLYLTGIRRGAWTTTGDNAISAVDSISGMSAFMTGEFTHSFLLHDTIINSRKKQYLVFQNNNRNIVEFRYSVSFISTEQAHRNIETEIPGWTFDEVKGKAEREWTKALGRISVKGGTDAQKRTFYTALYRCYERMVNITEDGKYYSNYDGKIHDAQRPFYIDDWIWDTYLALHPLRTILEPEKEADMIDSYVRMYEQSGWLPTFPILWGDNPCMNGFHSTIMILDAYRKGIRNFNVEKAYEAMKKNATAATMLPWRNGTACSLDTFYYEKGWYPALHPGKQKLFCWFILLKKGSLLLLHLEIVTMTGHLPRWLKNSVKNPIMNSL